MEDYKLASSSFQSRVKLTTIYTTPKVDATLYAQLVGILVYLTQTHLNISFVAGIIAWYMQTPHESHYKAEKRIIQYA